MQFNHAFLLYHISAFGNELYAPDECNMAINMLAFTE